MDNTDKKDSCTDAISRQAALALTKEINIPTGNAYVYYSHKCIEPQDILDLPPVSVAEKTGYWIDTGSGQECSECREVQYGYDNHRFYCQNCGAKMIEPQKSEDKKWERWEKSCVNCKYENKKYKKWPCVDCLDKDRWEKQK